MQFLFNQTELQKVQDHFCTLCHLFTYVVNEHGDKLTKMSGDVAGVQIIKELIPDDTFYRLFTQISDSELEDIIVADSPYDNIKLAAVTVKMQDLKTNCWLICGVLSDVTEGNIYDFPGEKLTTREFYSALDMVARMQKKCVDSELELRKANDESRRIKGNETEQALALRYMGAMTSVLQYLESDLSFDDTAREILKITGEYLAVGEVLLFQVKRDDRFVDMIADYLAPGQVRILDELKNIPRSAWVSSDKPLIVSSSTLSSAEIADEMQRIGVHALVSMPLFVAGTPAMYLCVMQADHERVFTRDEIKFISDVTKVLQSLLNKRIQKSSLAGSYASLQEILDNVGTGIYVVDAQTKKGLFANRLMKHTFADEIKDGSIEVLIRAADEMIGNRMNAEVIHEKKDKWYDLYHVQIGWIDGRSVDLYAFYDITDKKAYQRKIEQQAYTDFLTGLYNRMCCEKDLAKFVDRAKKNRTHGGVIYIDLDDFKHINDALGHQYGDELLQMISQAFRKVPGIESTCYRMGGDEFVILVAPEHYDEFNRIISDVKLIFSKPWYLKDADYYCTMSMGYCSFPDDGISVAEIIKKADIAMYSAKKSGKNKVAKYSLELTDSASAKRLDMEKNMRDATKADCNEFAVYYQPITDVHLPGNPCVGAEALVRWNSAALGFISPADFIPLAEYLGLITPIGTYVLREACRTCKGWNDNGHPNYKVNVNLSVVQLLQSDIVDVVRCAIEDTGIDPQNLTLEVTESLAIDDMERMQAILNSIRSLGVRIALDDFGTGYSSLNHIREIPLDVIKVDQCFVQKLDEDDYSQSFIKMVAELATALDVNVCVEGIETAAQFKILEGMKVDLVQGYYFGKPMPKEAFEEKYVK